MAKTFSEHVNFETDPNVILVIDGLNLAFRWKARPTTFNPEPAQQPFADEYLQVVKSLSKSYKAGKVIIACDAGSSWRREIHPDYKQNRRDKQLTQTQYEKEIFEEFIAEFNRAIERTDSTKWLVLRYSGVEADDIAAYICKLASRENKNVWLVSSDKDWNLLVDTHVSQFSYVTRKEYTYDNWDEHYDFSIDEYISIKCLQGDLGDNVRGVDAIGPKRALTLVKQYGSAMDIAEAIPIPGKSVYIKNLNESKDIILRNYMLMDLKSYCEDSIGAHLDDLQKTLLDYIK